LVTTDRIPTTRIRAIYGGALVVAPEVPVAAGRVGLLLQMQGATINFYDR
jgi:hypothetical protein